jgi:subtilase family serine protease
MRSWKFLLPLLASTVCFAAQPDRIAGVIDSSSRVELPRSVHPRAQAQFDQGPVDPAMKLASITLFTAPSATQQAALNLLLAQQQDRKSPNYHKWLTPAQFADRFGLSPNDIGKLTAWLKSAGFAIQNVGGGRNAVTFSGTAAQVQSAFGTEIHTYAVGGKEHFANSSPVMIPAALSRVAASVMGLHDFLPRPVNRGGSYEAMGRMRPDYYDANFAANFIAPGDVATIYDINPLYNAATPIDGTGQKLAIIGQTDVYLADIADFRTGFSLNPITGCTTNSSGVITACNSPNFQYVAIGTDPGVVYPCGDLGEADLDIEWSGAVARNAQIVFVNAPFLWNSNCTAGSGGGVNLALTSAIDPASGPPLAPVISMSYGICELEAEDLETVLQQGNAEGVTILNSSDDIGSAGCDFNPPNNNQPFLGATGGLAVSYPASSPEVTGVGGTEISIANDAQAPSTYWSTTTGTTGGSATEYIPEIPWNDDEELATYCASNTTNSFCSQGGSTRVTGWVPLTASATAAQVQEDIWISMGGGGASNCWTESNANVCQAGFAQPTWQQSLSVAGAPAGVRYVPDVSLIGSPNFPGYIYCTQISELGETGTGSSCGTGGAAGITNSVNTYQALVGGTSVSSPVFAGIVTLLNQYLQGPSSAGLGNINSELYTLAATPANTMFHPVTTGDNNVYCQKNQPANQPTALQCPASGVMGYSAAHFDATTKYNLVNGLGSVDVNNLAVAWAATRTATTTAISTSSGNANLGDNVMFTATVTPFTATGSVSFYNNSSTTALGAATISGGTATFSTTALPVGTDSVTAAYDGSGTQSGSTSPAPAVVTVTAPDFMLTAGNLIPSTIPAGQSATVTLTVAPVVGSATITFTSGSCAGLPTGATCSFNPSMVTFGGVSGTGMTVMTVSTLANMTVPLTVQNITVTGTTSGVSHSVPVSLTITATNQTFTLTARTTTFSVAPGAAAPVQIAVTGTNGFIISSSSSTALPLTYTCSTGLPSAAICNFSPGQGSGISNTAVTLSIATSAPITQLHPPFGGSRIFYALMLPGLFGIVLTAGSRRRGSRLLGLVVVLGFSTLWLGSCGGSSSSQKNPGTPAGTYSVVVTATTAGPNMLTPTTPLTITLTVQ